MNVREFNAFAYNKIDWAKMDSNNDGYVSPKEMKDHYKKAKCINKNVKINFVALAPFILLFVSFCKNIKHIHFVRNNPYDITLA